jgi:endonuclease/exonuclease/phosphatase (EEP) superfamily protein YafD
VRSNNFRALRATGSITDMPRWLGTFVWLGIVALTGGTAAGFYGEFSWILELAAHFRPHLVALSFIWLFLAIFQRRPIAAIACAALLAVNAAPIVPYVTAQAPPVGEGGSSLRVMTYNMHGRTTQRAAFFEFVHAEQPDVILLTEVPNYTDWLTDSLGADYPHRIDGNSGRPHDLMVFSRWPVAGFHIDRSVDRALPVLAADLCEEGSKEPSQCVRLVGLHAVAPFGPAAEKHDAQLALAARLLAAAPPGRAILAGDLNMTPWAPDFRRLIAATGLRDAALGRGVTATWMSRQPMVGLTIDHVLAGPEIAVRDYLVGPDLGSDHLPVVAGLVVPKARHPAVQGAR